MQTEDQILIAVYSAFGLLTIGSIAFRKFWVFIRLVEAAAIFPTSFLVFYFFSMTLASPGELQYNNALLAIAGVSGISALWVALFLTTSQYLKSTTLALIVVVGLYEIVLEAGAYTILFAVTVKVVDKAKDDVVEALKRRPPITDGEDDKECVDGYERCILSGGGGRGNNWNTTVCENCLRVCQNKGGWPYSVPIFGRGNPSCY